MSEEWAEARDPSSGRAYYYSLSTGDVAWSLPRSAVLVPTPNGDGTDEDTSSAPPDSGSRDNKLADKPADKPVGELESVDKLADMSADMSADLPSGKPMKGLDRGGGDSSPVQEVLATKSTSTSVPPVASPEAAPSANKRPTSRLARDAADLYDGDGGEDRARPVDVVQRAQKAGQEPVTSGPEYRGRRSESSGGIRRPEAAAAATTAAGGLKAKSSLPDEEVDRRVAAIRSRKMRAKARKARRAAQEPPPTAEPVATRPPLPPWDVFDTFRTVLGGGILACSGVCLWNRERSNQRRRAVLARAAAEAVVLERPAMLGNQVPSAFSDTLEGNPPPAYVERANMPSAREENDGAVVCAAGWLSPAYPVHDRQMAGLQGLAEVRRRFVRGDDVMGHLQPEQARSLETISHRRGIAIGAPGWRDAMDRELAQLQEAGRDLRRALTQAVTAAGGEGAHLLEGHEERVRRAFGLASEELFSGVRPLLLRRTVEVLVSDGGKQYWSGNAYASYSLRRSFLEVGEVTFGCNMLRLGAFEMDAENCDLRPFLRPLSVPFGTTLVACNGNEMMEFEARRDGWLYQASEAYRASFQQVPTVDNLLGFNAPQVGELRVRYEIVYENAYTALGRQDGCCLRPLEDGVFVMHPGSLALAELVSWASACLPTNHRYWTYALQVLGFYLVIDDRLAPFSCMYPATRTHPVLTATLVCAPVACALVTAGAVTLSCSTRAWAQPTKYYRAAGGAAVAGAAILYVLKRW